MQVFVYEFITGGGLWSLGNEPPAGSLLAEGHAMAAAVKADFRQAGFQVRSMRDARLGRTADSAEASVTSAQEEQSWFARLAAESDWTLVIAPETGGALLSRCRWVDDCGGRLLSPADELIALASDKCATAEHLGKHGVPRPEGIRIELSQPLAPLDAVQLFPAVLKPIDGCGSQDVRLVTKSTEFQVASLGQPMRLERFAPGLAASVAVLCGPAQLIPLPACEQQLSHDGRFLYRGGRLPLPVHLDRRACRLALAATQTLPDPLGYIGVDLVLGDDPSGADDYVIEINPRLTTSYVGLRAFCRTNLAAAMIAVATLKEPSLSWRSGAVEFSAEGRVEMTGGEAYLEPCG